jgi:hypothetical protein
MRKFKVGAGLTASAVLVALATTSYAQLIPRGFPMRVPGLPQIGTPGQPQGLPAAMTADQPLLNPCSRPEMRSAGNVQKMTATVGRPNGVPEPVQGISDLAPSALVQLAEVRIHPGLGGQPVADCHATLQLTDGRVVSGIFSISDPGQYAPLQYWWMSDTDIANQRAQVDHLRTAKNLYVTPDLITPEVQVCVGRQTALGLGEEFPGQLWAACAAKDASLR